MREPNFGHRLHDALKQWGPLCVGIDPHSFLLEQWGLPDSALGVEQFGLRVVAAAKNRVAIVKPQVAFFERHGSQGYAALETVLAAAREAGVMTIADVKRGDVGSTLKGYAEAWLTPGGPLEADAMTVSAYQGVGSLSGAVTLARESGKGLFVLGATSNPEAVTVQSARVVDDGVRTVTVASHIVNDVIALNALDDTNYGSFGVVLGATVAMSEYGITVDSLAASPSTPILAPGFGHQGAKFSEISERFGPHACVLVSVSRSVLALGPQGIEQAMKQAAEEIAQCRV